jgi:RNA polymerase sigma-70 factor (ECF subfamily)
LSEPQDAEIVSAVTTGDRDAYAILVRRYAARIYAVCLATLFDAEESKDLAQEALLKGLTRIHSLRDGSKFAPWLTRIAQNLCRDHRRRGRRRQELMRERIAESAGAVTESPPDLSDALARLPEKYRVPLMLYYFDGQNSQSVADALNLSRNGASTRLARARQALRHLLEASHE